MTTLDDYPPSPDRMPLFLARFQADRSSLERLYTARYSPGRRARFRALLTEWEEPLEALPFDTLTRSDRADWLLFRDLLRREGRRLDREERQFREMEPFISFAADLIALEDERRLLEGIDGERVAERLDRAHRQIRETRTALEAELASGQTESPHPVA